MLLNNLEKQILNILQFEFPIEKKPFKKIADILEVSEKTILEEINFLYEKKIIRQISPIYNTKVMGYKSTLVAFKVKEKYIKETSEIINLHSGVSHNYLRNNEFNIWFTLAVSPEKNLEKNINELFEKTKAEDFLILPTLKQYKIGVIFEYKTLGEKIFDRSKILKKSKEIEPLILSDFDKKFISITQNNINIISEPFNQYSKILKMTVEKIVEKLNEFNKKNIMRRFAAILNHKTAGKKINCMVVWDINDNEVDSICSEFIKFDEISHCYCRPKYINWQWNVYTMIHVDSEKNFEYFLRKILDITPGTNYLALKTLQEFKKIRLRYFEEYK